MSESSEGFRNELKFNLFLLIIPRLPLLQPQTSSISIQYFTANTSNIVGDPYLGENACPFVRPGVNSLVFGCLAGSAEMKNGAASNEESIEILSSWREREIEEWLLNLSYFIFAPRCWLRRGEEEGIRKEGRKYLHIVSTKEYRQSTEWVSGILTYS